MLDSLPIIHDRTRSFLQFQILNQGIPGIQGYNPESRIPKLVLRIRFILIWIRILGSVTWNTGSCSESDPEYQLLFYLFFLKKICISPKYDLLCYLWGKIFMSVNISFIVLKKNVWYSNDFGWFMWKFSIILADFLLPESVSLKRLRIRLTKMKRIQTDPDPQHCLKQCKTHFSGIVSTCSLIIGIILVQSYISIFHLVHFQSAVHNTDPGRSLRVESSQFLKHIAILKSINQQLKGINWYFV